MPPWGDFVFWQDVDIKHKEWSIKGLWSSLSLYLSQSMKQSKDPEMQTLIEFYTGERLDNSELSYSSFSYN